MNSENKLIIHSNENDKEINHYGKLLLAYKDYQLIEAIKLLPDDMIKEIKKYVMTPYKFMPELKLYKFPVFYCDNNNTLIKNNRRYETHFKTGYDVDIGDRIFCVRRLDTDELKRNCVIYNPNPILRQLNKIYIMKKAEIKKILTDNKIKGRTKLIKDLPHNNHIDGWGEEIIRALMKI